MQKVRYELDPFNRFVYDGSGGRNDLPEFRQVLDGQFSLDENNNLFYRIKAPLDKKEWETAPPCANP